MGSTPVGQRPSPHPAGYPSVSFATYNILLGGGGRWSEITELLRSVDADVVALQEADDRAAVARAADQLGYQLIFGKIGRAHV